MNKRLKNKRMAFNGFWLMIFSAVFGLIETWAFGWNMFPKSVAEIFCDILSLTLDIIGSCMLLIGYAIETKYKYQDLKNKS